MEVIRTAGLRKVFASSRRNSLPIEAVTDITFSVNEGERLAYIGPNGAGKSTSIKILTGVLHPTSGEAHVLGLVPWNQRRQLTRKIGVLFGQRSQLWPELTARQGLRLLGAIYRLDRDAVHNRIEEVAELLSAEDLLDEPVRSLSLGQRMRCELAASIVHSPSLLFLDEPTIGLDLVAKQRFRDLLLSLNADKNMTIFLTSHDVTDIEAIASRVVVINHGRIIADDSVAALRRSLLSRKSIEVRFERPCDPVVIAGAQVVEASTTTCKLHVDTSEHSIQEVLDALLASWPVADISVADPPLDEVITNIYARR